MWTIDTLIHAAASRHSFKMKFTFFWLENETVYTQMKLPQLETCCQYWINTWCSDTNALSSMNSYYHLGNISFALEYYEMVRNKSVMDLTEVLNSRDKNIVNKIIFFYITIDVTGIESYIWQTDNTTHS